MCPHDTKCRNETSKKTATLILQLIRQKNQEQNTKKAQNKIFMHAKIYVKKHTLNICAKAYQRGLQAPTTWPMALANIFGKLRVRNCQVNQISAIFWNKKFDQSDSRIFFTRKHGCVVDNDRTAYFQNYLLSRIMNFM